MGVIVVIVIVVTGGKQSQLLASALGLGWSLTIKLPYLNPWAKNQKNKGTFFSSTFKVQESKVPLLF